ncbi:hypothetical protein [Dendronalium sp. ChiSLP03b]|uniref:oxidoreductase n=1 Tax=Dendronalium sp. ChiSLP03b TaxID=3075381 RepID=UPI002AD4B287|nr:hypothetical protein [Dendronalium sp. ChiSLP03b]MDZ8208457.1 hypothetical protein [Dendronalium sp. ChiSLP03b]
MIDVSTGALVPHAKIPVQTGYQVPFAAKIREEAGIATGAVGMITDAEYANQVITRGCADLVFIGRELLRDPYWSIRARATWMMNRTGLCLTVMQLNNRDGGNN